MRVLGPGAIVAILLLHVGLHGIEVAFAGIPPQCVGDPNPLCGTPASGFASLARGAPTDQGPSFFGQTLGKLPVIGELATVWQVVQAMWTALVGAFAVNYAWLKNDTYIGRLILFIVQAIMGGIAASWLFSIGIQAIGRR